MLPIKLNPNLLNGGKTYQNVITHLAANTLVKYRDSEFLPRGIFKPSFDNSQVCCWMCEKPLGNGMHLCSREDGDVDSNGKGNIRLFDESQSEDHQGEMEIQKTDSFDKAGNIANSLLICGDCTNGLKSSLQYFEQETSQQLIRDPLNPTTFVNDPLKDEYYIWPNDIIYWTGEHSTSIKANHSAWSQQPVVTFSTYYSYDCFVYRKKTAVVRYIHENEENHESNSTEFKTYVFIEPNPTIPPVLQEMAKNTIRLFKLNGLHYEHQNHDVHVLAYKNIENQTFYDDFRLAGRTKAHNRARTALKQLKQLRDAYLEPALFKELTEQQKILVELNGYRSLWAQVFNDGGDPDGFRDIGGLPVPSAPPISDGISTLIDFKANAFLFTQSNPEDQTKELYEKYSFYSDEGVEEEETAFTLISDVLSEPGNFELDEETQEVFVLKPQPTSILNDALNQRQAEFFESHNKKRLKQRFDDSFKRIEERYYKHFK